MLAPGISRPLVLISFFLFAVACTPTNNPPPHTGPDVYLTGYSNYTLNDSFYIGAVYWKNKTLVPLRGGQYATAIAITGSDVYVSGVAGYEVPAGWSTEAAYWKNEVITKLGHAPSYAASMILSGSDLYIAGNAEFDGVYVAAYWKNGVWTALSPNFHSSATGIAVSGQDVYVVGQDGVNGTQAVYWKNGVEHLLVPDTVSTATALTISGNDIYIAGSISADGTYPTAAYWKNGRRIDLEYPDLPQYHGVYASGIAVSGSDVYVIGYFDLLNAVYWKNDLLHKFWAPGFLDVTNNVNGIAIFNNDVYISSINCSYWKNDTLINVDNGYSTSIKLMK